MAVPTTVAPSSEETFQAYVKVMDELEHAGYGSDGYEWIFSAVSYVLGRPNTWDLDVLREHGPFASKTPKELEAMGFALTAVKEWVESWEGASTWESSAIKLRFDEVDYEVTCTLQGQAEVV
ncbi:hypothetical protein EOL96_02595 [Candidatus Saccharibacteria bacterium]|nr:hypothetical protein [Candidatus Saccharibacteria bacterium]